MSKPEYVWVISVAEWEDQSVCGVYATRQLALAAGNDWEGKRPRFGRFRQPDGYDQFVRIEKWEVRHE